jgi:hypothetical protein
MQNLNFSIILVSLIGYVGYILKAVPSTISNLIIKLHSFTLSVSTESDLLYMRLNTWLLSLNKKQLQNNINMKPNWVHDRRDDDADQESGVGKLTINYGQYTIMLDKFTIMKITKTRVDRMNQLSDIVDIMIIGKNKNKYKTMILEMMKKEVDTNNIIIFPGGQIHRGLLKPKKSMDDLFIENKLEIISHIDKWSGSKSFYNKHAITYKTGILLYGDPGTGKTTLIRAIASYLGYDIHIINMNAYKTVDSLLNKIINIPSKCIIAFEDIDCVVSKRTDDDKTDADNDMMSILLNIIDGLNSPEEVIFVATTNHIDKLDPALMREGRFDLKVNVGNISEKLAVQMCERYDVDREMILMDETYPINPAYLQAKILKYKKLE